MNSNEIKEDEIDNNVLTDEVVTDESDEVEDKSNEYFDSDDFEDDTDNEENDSDSEEDIKNSIDVDSEEELEATNNFIGSMDKTLTEISLESMNKLIESRDKLQFELKELAKQLEEIRKEGDISESSTYSATQNAVSIKRKELRDITNRISSSKVVKKKYSKTISCGDSIRLFCETIADKEANTYPGKLLEIVDIGFGNPMKGTISIDAPFMKEVVKLTKNISVPHSIRWKTTSNKNTTMVITEVIPGTE